VILQLPEMPPHSRGVIHFFHPGLVKRSGVSTFMCQGDQSPTSVFACEPIGKTALDLGIITSLDIVHSADPEAAKWYYVDRSFA
jgi:hypothetical protein